MEETEKLHILWRIFGFLFVFGARAPSGQRPPHSRGF